MNKKGQALIEFIIILPIFIMMMLAVFDIVKIYSCKGELESVLEDAIISDGVDDNEIMFIKNDVSNGISYEVSKKIDITSPVVSAITGNSYVVTVKRIVYE